MRLLVTHWFSTGNCGPLCTMWSSISGPSPKVKPSLFHLHGCIYWSSITTNMYGQVYSTFGWWMTHFSFKEDKRQHSEYYWNERDRVVFFCKCRFLFLAIYLDCEWLHFICLMNAVCSMSRCQIPSAVL